MGKKINSPKHNLEGKRFGKLVAQKEYKRETKDLPSGKAYFLYWLCKCDCGNEKWINANHLKRGQTRSCGCYSVAYRCRGRLLEKGLAAKNRCYAQYETVAKRNNRKFELTFEQFIDITSHNCYYCGAEPSNMSKSGKYSGDYIYNGVDRLDNSKGYILTNCVPCCKTCNKTKLKMSRKEFVDWVSRVYDHIVTGETWDAHRSYRRPRDAFTPSP